MFCILVFNLIYSLIRYTILHNLDGVTKGMVLYNIQYMVSYHIRDLRRIRRYMSLFVAKTIATALGSSRLDYCNSLLHNIAIKDITKLQRVQNCLARVVTRSPPSLVQYHF